MMYNILPRRYNRAKEGGCTFSSWGVKTRAKKKKKKKEKILRGLNSTHVQLNVLMFLNKIITDLLFKIFKNK